MRTYGEFLHMRRQAALDPRQVPSVRTRLTVSKRGGPDSKDEAGYDFYPDRRHLEDEFAQLWEAQAMHHAEVLTDDLRVAMFNTIFYQRPLNEPEIGPCLFSGHHDVLSDERRLPEPPPVSKEWAGWQTDEGLQGRQQSLL